MKIITLMHQKGGVGKSTLTFNLANNLKENTKVCILDVDYQGSLYQMKDISDIDIFHISELDSIKNLNYDIVFIDTPPYIFEGLEDIINLSDTLVIPTKAGIFDLLAIKSTIGIIKQLKAEDKAHILFNMVKPNTTLTDEIKSQIDNYNIPVFKTMISDLVIYSRSSLSNGVGENKTAQKQLDDLTKEILTQFLK